MDINKTLKLASHYQQEGNLQQAVDIYLELLEIQPNNFYALKNLGAICFELRNYDLAIACLKQALTLNSNDAGVFYNLGIALKEHRVFDEAIFCHKKAIQLNPNFADAYNNLGTALQEKGEIDVAINCYKKAIQLEPNYADAYCNLGVALNEKGKFHEAMDCFQKAVNLNNSDAENHWNFSLSLLLLGNFTEGFKEYEWRFKTSVVSRKIHFNKTLWHGEDISGLDILILTEQGLGDAIQFMRYASLIAKRGANVIVECQTELKSLIKNIEGIQEVVVRGQTLPSFNVYCFLLSLPLIFQTTINTIPATIPYINLEYGKVEKWRDKLKLDKSKLKIGLVWAGNPTYKGDAFRSCQLKTFSSLARFRDITFYSLQKGDNSQQAKNPPEGMNFIDLTEEINDFSDTASFIENLDLIVSVDTAVAHLAGALGKSVWTLLPFAPDWRWMLNRDDSPWYPTMRLFRQPSPGDWESVIAKVKYELLKWSINN